MKAMRLDINKKLGKHRITTIEYFESTIGSEVKFYLYNDFIASMLFADAPDWVRNFIQINRHNLQTVGVK